MTSKKRESVDEKDADISNTFARLMNCGDADENSCRQPPRQDMMAIDRTNVHHDDLIRNLENAKIRLQIAANSLENAQGQLRQSAAQQLKIAEEKRQKYAKELQKLNDDISHLLKTMNRLPSIVEKRDAEKDIKAKQNRMKKAAVKESKYSERVEQIKYALKFDDGFSNAPAVVMAQRLYNEAKKEFDALHKELLQPKA